jgi:hypothetical protein
MFQMAENNAGISDGDLNDVVQNLDGQKEAGSNRTPDKDAVDPAKLDLGQFKTVEDLQKAYKEIQGAYTTTNQEKIALQNKMKEMEEQISMMSPNVSYQQGGDASDNTFDQDLLDNPKVAMMQTYNEGRIAEVLEEENDKDPQNFQERYAFVQMLSRQVPPGTMTAVKVKKLFKMADERRKEALKQNANKALEHIFGEPLNDEEVNRLKAIVKGKETKKDDKINKDALMPDDGNASHVRSDAGTDWNKEIRESADKGNVDATLDAVFNKALSE